MLAPMLTPFGELVCHVCIIILIYWSPEPSPLMIKQTVLWFCRIFLKVQTNISVGIHLVSFVAPCRCHFWVRFRHRILDAFLNAMFFILGRGLTPKGSPDLGVVWEIWPPGSAQDAQQKRIRDTTLIFLRFWKQCWLILEQCCQIVHQHLVFLHNLF